MSLTGKATADQELNGKINGLETIRGYSAYEIALIHGFVGTEEEWLDSLNGGIITVDKQLYRSGHAADAAVVGEKFKEMRSEFSASNAVQDARLDELVAMRSDGSLYEHNHDASDIEFSIQSNGVTAGIGGRVISKTISPGYANALKVNIPDEFRPFEGSVMLYSDDTMRIMLSVTDNDAQLCQLVVVNDTASNLTVTEKYFDGYYALRDVVVGELGDARIGYDGTTYPTVGEAVRGQIKQVRNGTAFTDDTKIGTNAWSSKNTVDKLCPAFDESGGVAICEPVEGYPLEVVSTINEKADGSAWDSITLKQCGKNLFDFKQPVSHVTYMSSDGQGSRYGYSFALPAGTYTMHAEPIGEVKNQYIYCVLNDFNGNLMTVDGFSFLKQGTKYFTRTFTLTEPARVFIYNGLSSGTEATTNALFHDDHNVQIEAGAAATPYEEYRNGGQWTVDFANLDTSENGAFSFGNYNWQTGVLDTEENGMYQHDPETDTFTYIKNSNYIPPIVRNIPAMSGTNYFYSDCGNTTVNGKSDPVKIIDKLTNAILALGGNV